MGVYTAMARCPGRPRTGKLGSRGHGVSGRSGSAHYRRECVLGFGGLAGLPRDTLLARSLPALYQDFLISAVMRARLRMMER